MRLYISIILALYNITNFALNPGEHHINLDVKQQNEEQKILDIFSKTSEFTNFLPNNSALHLVEGNTFRLSKLVYENFRHLPIFAGARWQLECLPKYTLKNTQYDIIKYMLSSNPTIQIWLAHLASRNDNIYLMWTEKGLKTKDQIDIFLNLPNTAWPDYMNPKKEPKVEKNYTRPYEENLIQAEALFSNLGPEVPYLTKQNTSFLLEGTIGRISETRFRIPLSWKLPGKYRLNKKTGCTYANQALQEIKVYVFRNKDDKRTKADPNIRLLLAHKIIGGISYYYSWTSVGLSDESLIAPLFRGTSTAEFQNRHRRAACCSPITNAIPEAQQPKTDFSGSYEEIYGGYFLSPWPDDFDSLLNDL